LIFDFCKTKKSPTGVCTREVFDQLLQDPLVVQNCYEIKQLDEKMQAAIGEEQEKQLKQQIDKLKGELPAFCFHASFSDHHRCNESAVPSGLVSLDLDDIENPTEFFDRLRDQAIARELLLAFITPGTHGLKLVFPVPVGCRTLEEAQERLVNELGLQSYFDTVCRDMARMAFVSPFSYVLYRDDDRLFDPSSKAPEGFCTERELDQQIIANQQSTAQCEELPIPQAETETAKQFIDGIPISDLIRELCIQACGQAVPTEGVRNSCLYDVAKAMRVYVGDDPRETARVMPMWGLDRAEWWNTIRSAHSRPISSSTRRQAEALLQRLKRQKAVNEGDATWSLPAPPKVLPPVFREFARVVPLELQPAVFMSLLSILGFYGSMAKANLAEPDEEPEWRTPSFLTIISAPPASQKGVITNIFYKLTDELRRREQALLEQLNRYNASKKEENKPKEPILLMPERLSMTSLSVQLENARGHHLLMFTPEIDTLKSSNGSGNFNDLSTVFRKAPDNDLLGQIFVSAESHCCNVPVRLNMIIQAQPETLNEFLGPRQILNGLDTRCIIVDLPDSTGCRKLKVKKMSDFEWKNVMDTIHYLEQIGQVTKEAEYDEEGNLISPREMDRQIISLPRTRKELERWGIGHQDHYLQSQENPAEDHYFRRAKMLAFHAAIVAAMCCRCHDSKVVTDFALWVAEYILQSQMLHFGKTYNSMYQKRQDQHVEDVIAINQLQSFNLFDALPQEFTSDTMHMVMQQHGRTLSNPYNNTHRWLKNGMIEEIPGTATKKRWRKCGPQISRG